MKNRIKVIASEDDVYKTGVYKIYHESFPESFYVGSTKKADGRKGKIGFSARFHNHISPLNKSKHHSKRLQSICDNYGINGLIMEILEICDPSLCFEREQYYLDILKPDCNTCTISTSCLLYKHTPEALQKMSEKQKGKIVSNEARAKISARLKGKMPKNIKLLMSPEIRAKAGQSNKGRIHGKIFMEAVSTPVYQFTPSGEIISCYESIQKAFEYTGINRPGISLAASGKRATAGGYLWSTKENGHHKIR